MSFLNPFAFLFLLSVPVLVLLYFLKLKRPQVRVPSTLLWQKVIEDMRVNSPFQKLKRSFLLLLQLLALLAAIFALARPLFRVRENVNESIIVLLDNSASMMTKEPEGKTRLNLARSEILRMADHLAKDDEMMLITFSSKAKALCGFTNNRRQLKEVVSRIEAEECSTAIEPGLLLAKSIANSRANPRIILVSDGAFAPASNVEMPVETEYLQIGSTRPNLAITGLDIRRSLSDRNKIEMFVSAENFSRESFAGNMIVHLDRDILDSKYFSVGPEETLSQIFEAVLPAGGNIKVEFEADDSLKCDNRAWKVVRPPLHRRILIVGDNTFFIERAFKASTTIDCMSVSKAEYVAPEPGEFSAVIWNNVATPEIAACNNIYLGCFPEIDGVTAGGKLDSPDVLDWDNTHPINRFLDFDNLVMSAATSMTLPDYAAVIVRSSQTPLVGVFEVDAGTVCIVGFNPIQSNWPLLVSFPLFLNNCLDHFEEQQKRKVDTNIAVGKTITSPSGTEAPVIERPDGRKKNMTRNASGDFSFADVDVCGIYRVNAPGGASHSVAANLFDRNESQLNSVESPVIGGQAVKNMQVQKQVNREYWKYLVMALAGFLLIEWIVYHRRLFV
jgi:Ca-activated chloride channel family protein